MPVTAAGSARRPPTGLAGCKRANDSTAAFNLGVALEDLGRRAEAISAYQLAVVGDPPCADAHYNLSRIYEHLGQGAPALRHLRTYRALTGEG